MSFGRSREKLYGLKSLSKSQGVLDIYRSLECLRQRKNFQRTNTENILPIFKCLDDDVTTSCTQISTAAPEIRIEDTSALQDSKIEKCDETVESEEMKSNVEKTDLEKKEKENKNQEAEENLDSLRSAESDTLTEDSDEIQHDSDQQNKEDASESAKRLSQRQHSDISNHSNNSGNSDDKDERSTESETEEPRYTVAQLISAFNKHQEVATKTSLEAIMTEKKVNEVTFPTGHKALRLFIPDIDITERTIVRRKTSYKPRKNWEELRKRNEKNEGIVKDLDHDSGNEDDDEDEECQLTNVDKALKESAENTKINDIRIEESQQWVFKTPDNNCITDNEVNTKIDEKYKQCVDNTKSSKEELKPVIKKTSTRYHKERIANYIIPEATAALRGEKKATKSQNAKETKNKNKTEDSAVNLKDILLRDDSFQKTPKENLENLRKRTSLTKIIINDKQFVDSNDSNNNDGNSAPVEKAKVQTPSTSEVEQHEESKLEPPQSFDKSASSESGNCLTEPSAQTEIETSWEDVNSKGSNISLEGNATISLHKKKAMGMWIPHNNPDSKTKKPLNKKNWGKVCTGSYTRAMEKFNGKNNEAQKKTASSASTTQQQEKPKRKNVPAGQQLISS